MTTNVTEAKTGIALLSDLVTWAAANHAHMEDFLARFPGWGQWNQTLWAQEVRNGECQTAYCIAGQAVAQSDYLLIMNEEERYDGTTVLGASRCAPKIETGTFDEKGKPIFTWNQGEEVDIDDKATELLGLEEDETRLLFDGDNDIETVVTLASYFARKRGQRLEIPSEVAAEYDRMIDGDEDLRRFRCHRDFLSCRESENCW